MEANGWVFSWTDVRDFWPEGSLSSYCDNVPTTSYCGWCISGCVGELSLTLELSGYEKGWLEIDYGANLDSSGTSLFLNDELQDSTTELSRTFDLYFVDGDTLMLSEKKDVLVINSIDFFCLTSPPATAPSESPSPRPSSYQTGKPIPPATAPSKSPSPSPSSYQTDKPIPPTTAPSKSPSPRPSSYQTDKPIPTLRPNPIPTTTPTSIPNSKPDSFPPDTVTYSPTSTPTIPTIRPTPLSYPTDPVMAPTIVPTIKASKTTHMVLEPIHIYSILGTVITVLCVIIIFLLTRRKKTVKFSPAVDLRQQTFANTPALPDYSSDSSEQQLEGEEREGIPETGGFVTPTTITWSKSGNIHMRL